MGHANSNLPRLIDGLGLIAGFYDGFILDLWGVVHDGIAPLPGAIDTLKELRRAKRLVWLLSNAPRRAWVVAEKLSAMGIGEELYDGITTSGEATWGALKETYLSRWGSRCFHLGPREKDASLVEDLYVTLKDSPAEADFVLNSGPLDFKDTAEQYAPVLDECLERGLPMLCANPDRVVHVGEQLVVCAGLLAEMYEKRGGDVTWFGKPYRGVYSLCLANMGVQRVLAVGDGMVTDIAGATAAGLDSVLVAGGIHRAELGPEDLGATADNTYNYSRAVFGGVVESRMREMLRKYPYRPAYLLPSFRW